MPAQTQLIKLHPMVDSVLGEFAIPILTLAGDTLQLIGESEIIHIIYRVLAESYRSISVISLDTFIRKRPRVFRNAFGGRSNINPEVCFALPCAACRVARVVEATIMYRNGAAKEDDRQSERMRRVGCVSCMIGRMLAILLQW